MSTDTSEPENNSGTDAREVEKDVTIEAYAPMDADYDDERAFLDNELLPDIDWYEETTTESTVYRLVFPNGREISLDSSDYETVKDDIASGEIPNDGISVRETTETDTDYVNSTWSASRKFRDRLTEALPDEIGDLQQSGRDYYLDETPIASIRAGVGYNRVLQHQQRRTDDNRYETDDYTWGVTVTVSFGPAPHDDIDGLSEQVVPQIVDALRKDAWCEKVRVAECKVEREGDCFV